MSRLLIGWEFGGGSGHLAIIAAATERLRAAGHEIILALKDGSGAADYAALQGLPLLAAPTVKSIAPTPKTVAYTLADVLSTVGLADVNFLNKLVARWRVVLEAVRPDVVVCEYAPGLALAALGSWPVITIGVGYVCPPTGAPFPPLRFWASATPDSSLDSEARLAEAMAHARAGLRKAQLRYPSDAFGGEAQVVCTWPELDVYGARRGVPAAGSARPLPLSIASTDGQAFFYLANGSALPGLLHAMHASGVPAQGYVRGLNSAARRRLERPGLRLFDQPQDLAVLLRSSSVLVHHGGIGAAEAALAAGTPQVVLARHLEQLVNGMTIERNLGIGKVLLADDGPERLATITAVVERMAGESVVRDRARALANELGLRAGPTWVDKVEEAAARLA